MFSKPKFTLNFMYCINYFVLFLSCTVYCMWLPYFNNACGSTGPYSIPYTVIGEIEPFVTRVTKMDATAK